GGAGAGGRGDDAGAAGRGGAFRLAVRDQRRPPGGASGDGGGAVWSGDGGGGARGTSDRDGARNRERSADPRRTAGGAGGEGGEAGDQRLSDRGGGDAGDGARRAVSGGIVAAKLGGNAGHRALHPAGVLPGRARVRPAAGAAGEQPAGDFTFAGRRAEPELAGPAARFQQLAQGRAGAADVPVEKGAGFIHLAGAAEVQQLAVLDDGAFAAGGQEQMHARVTLAVVVDGAQH